MTVNPVPVEGSIRLGQLLKLVGLAGTGADARDLLAGGDVSVNGEAEERRGRQLVTGDRVTVHLPDGTQEFELV